MARHGGCGCGWQRLTAGCGRGRWRQHAALGRWRLDLWRGRVVGSGVQLGEICEELHRRQRETSRDIICNEGAHGPFDRTSPVGCSTVTLLCRRLDGGGLREHALPATPRLGSRRERST
eukprot:5891526-Prymnesium_polylepis.1